MELAPKRGIDILFQRHIALRSLLRTKCTKVGVSGFYKKIKVLSDKWIIIPMLFPVGIVSVSVCPKMLIEIEIGPKLKFYLFPLTRPTLKKSPTQKKLFQFSVKNIFF